MMNKLIVYLLIAAVVALCVVTISLLATFIGNDDGIVYRFTDSGEVRGVKVESDISDFYAFFSIPYAEAPIDELRFKAPVPKIPWEGYHDGTTEGPACTQNSGQQHQSEDCLTLSIYTSDVTASGRPVYVWIHGGALEASSAKIAPYGPHYFMKHNIVLVAVQFRLDIFGFLNLNLEDAPGNMGLADTIEALKWVRANIAHFGGDPDRVTLGGISSGGIMTHALQISPLAQGLFHQVIIQSGTSLSYRFDHENVQPLIDKTKAALNMQDSSNEHVLAHLKTLNSLDLLQLNINIKQLYPDGYATYYPYAITRDYHGILTGNPIDMVWNNSYQHMPMLIGTTSDEGIRLEEYMDLLPFVNDHFGMVVPTDLFSIDDMSAEKNETALCIKEFYFGDKELSRDTFPTYAQMCMDSWYGHITDYLIRLKSFLQYRSSIYYYMFAVDGAYNVGKIRSQISSPGVNHGDDLGYMWEQDLTRNIVPEDDFSDISRERLVAMWSNFINFGNPTPETNELLPVIWEPVDYPSVKYLLINRTVSMEQEPLRERLQFWQRVYGWMEL